MTREKNTIQRVLIMYSHIEIYSLSNDAGLLGLYHTSFFVLQYAWPRRTRDASRTQCSGITLNLLNFAAL